MSLKRRLVLILGLGVHLPSNRDVVSNLRTKTVAGFCDICEHYNSKSPDAPCNTRCNAGNNFIHWKKGGVLRKPQRDEEVVIEEDKMKEVERPIDRVTTMSLGMLLSSQGINIEKETLDAIIDAVEFMEYEGDPIVLENYVKKFLDSSVFRVFRDEV